MSQQCKCGKGHVSQWDAKCGHCRTKKEQRDHELALTYMELTLANSSMTPQEAYNCNRKLFK